MIRNRKASLSLFVVDLGITDPITMSIITHAVNMIAPTAIVTNSIAMLILGIIGRTIGSLPKLRRIAEKLGSPLKD
jgi:hypothetical protein